MSFKEKLKKMPIDKRYISGIYNYCDRWCERCPQTSRCLNYAMSEEEFGDRESKDIQNEAFWKKMSEVLQGTLDLVKEMAVEKGMDLDEIDLHAYEEEHRSVRAAAENHVLCRAA